MQWSPSPPPPPDSEQITGTVNRPNDQDTQVTLTATLTKNEASDTKSFTLTVILLEDAAAVQQAKSALMLTYAAGDSRISVTQDVMLPTAGANGVSISWETSDAARISTTGTVSRPNDQNTQVTLTATLTKNAASDERTFLLTVILLEDDAAVEMAKNALMIGYAADDSAESVTQNVTLPTAGANGVSISWASSNAARVSTTGTVSRPSTANTAVTLTATLTKNTARDTRTFTLTVIISEDGMDVEMAKDSLMIGYAAGNSRTSVTQDVMLPTAGANGVNVSWESSDAARVSTTGTVSRPSAANTEVTLIATLTKNDARDTRSFTLTVVPPCTTSEMTAKLKAMPPSLSSCSAASIRGADMPALRSAGVTSAQFLPVWSADRDMGFTPAQLKEADVTVAEMKSHGLTIAQVQTGGFSIADLRSGGFADYRVFNEACNTSSTFCTEGDLTMEEVPIECTAAHPTITLTPTTLSMNMPVVLEGATRGSLIWLFSGIDRVVSFSVVSSVGDTGTLGSSTAELTEKTGTNFTSTLSIPLADVFSNPRVTVTDSQERRTNIQLCPGR